MDKELIDSEIKRQQMKLNPLNEDFLMNLSPVIRDVLDTLRWKYQDRSWFNKAWEEYRSEVLNAGLNGKFKMPKEIFGPYVSEEVKKSLEKMEKASDMPVAVHDGFDSEEDVESFLEHHGIKGQKWGVRRYQNEDGTLTEAGKVRYNPDGSKKDVNKMTDEELARANKRIAAEQQFQNLTGSTQPGKALTKDNAIKIGATFVATGASTFLLRAWRKDRFLEPNYYKRGKNAGKVKPGRGNLGKSLAIAALAGGIGALVVGSRTLGAESSLPKGGPLGGGDDK